MERYFLVFFCFLITNQQCEGFCWVRNSFGGSNLYLGWLLARLCGHICMLVCCVYIHQLQRDKADFRPVDYAKYALSEKLLEMKEFQDVCESTSLPTFSHNVHNRCYCSFGAVKRVELMDVSYEKRNCTSLCIHSPPYMVLCAVHVVLRRLDPSQGLPVHMCSHLTILALNLKPLYLLHGARSIMSLCLSVCLSVCLCCCYGYCFWLFFALLCEQKLLQHETTSDLGLQFAPFFLPVVFETYVPLLQCFAYPVLYPYVYSLSVTDCPPNVTLQFVQMDDQ